jgi:imidazolonepropionase-like amidohydrolase
MSRLSPASRVRMATVAALALVALSLATVAIAATPRVHAIVGARIVTAPGQVIPRGNIVMRDGIIVAVGPNAVVPADARVWKGDSLTVYPGLIDAFVMPAPEVRPPGPPAAASPFGAPAPPAPPRGAVHELTSVHPETRVAAAPPLGAEQLEALRAAGFTAAQIAPRSGILRGQSAVVGLGDGTLNANLVSADAAQVISIETMPNGYPGSLMGAIAVIRQALLDARWYRDAHAAYDRSPQKGQRPEENLAWEALGPLVASRQHALFVADDMLEVLRSAALAKEAGISAQVVGAGDEYKRVREIAATALPLIVPVNFPEAPDVADAATALEVSTQELRHWDQAPGNPAALRRAGVTFALTANGLKDVKGFRGGVRRAIERGLGADDALAAVTTVPARLLGLADRLGTIAPGRIANLTVTRGDLYSENGKVREVWVDGNRYETARPEDSIKGSWTVRAGDAWRTMIVAVERDTSVRMVMGADTLRAMGVRFEAPRLRFTLPHGGAPAEAFDVSAKDDLLEGTMASGESSRPVSGRRQPDSETHPKDARRKDEPVPTPVVSGDPEAWRMVRPTQPAAVLIRGATVWTGGPQGTLEGADVLVTGGRIAAVGKGLAAPKNALVIDGAGKHVSPGIIDCHNHWAILGNVNECTHNVTSEVRVQDVINSESINIYRELAGGVTTVQLLHGSCNAIGGQSAVVKFKWGEPPEALLFPGAIPGIKFALGENPKQSNFQVPGAVPRYPQTRAGVEQLIRDSFTRARDYRDAMNEFKQGKRPLPPRRDLQLDPLVEILEGRRLIHSHAYRQDELLMLMRVAEEFGFRVGTFQHVLEGYKVADEMAKHGVGASTFSDWWAYKQEVADAIPYNGYLMWDRGVTVSYNSDDAELARRLNTEAAKAIKYGGVPPAEALKFVTLNPARQLRIDARVGSLEPGKDADFAIWSGSPLSPYSHCEQTWIEGRKYFDRGADQAGRAALEKERDALIAKARGSKKSAAGPVAGNWPPRYLDDTDMSGNDCGGGDGTVFLSESARRAWGRGEEVAP